MLDQDNWYDGILCINDEVAYGVMQEAERRGYHVGQDLAVVGIDNLRTSALDRVSLTSIHINYELMTTLAVNTLINGIESGHEITSKIMLEPELVVRSSSLLSGAQIVAK
jgi:LacI family transcriptional regulator